MVALYINTESPPESQFSVLHSQNMVLIFYEEVTVEQSCKGYIYDALAVRLVNRAPRKLCCVPGKDNLLSVPLSTQFEFLV